MTVGLQSLAGKILHLKDLRPIFAGSVLCRAAVFAAFAWAMMK
jgi:hypothetical protein